MAGARQENKFNPVCQGILNEALKGREHIPVMTWQEGIALGETITNLREEIGLSVLDVMEKGEYPVPKDMEEKFHIYQRAANQLSERNLGLIDTVFYNNPIYSYLPSCEIKDLIGVAQEQLMRCARLYNPWRDLKESHVKYVTHQPLRFSGYAITSMSYKIIRGYHGLRTIRIPESQWAKCRSYYHARRYVQDQYGCEDFDTIVSAAVLLEKHDRMPTSEEIESVRQTIKEVKRSTGEYPKDVSDYEYIISAIELCSLDGENYEDVQDEFGKLSHSMHDLEFVPSGQSVDQEAQERICRDTIGQLLETTLRPHEQRTLSLKFWDDLNQSEIARRLGVSKQCISKRVEEALRKFRDPHIQSMLRDYWDYIE